MNEMSPAKEFSPGVIDYDGRMSACYQSGRALSSAAASMWTAIVAPFVQRGIGTRILDLGSGTGRFLVLFAESFDNVIGIEPSKGMLAAGASAGILKNLAYVAGSAESIESIPLRGQSCELAWLSQVWHHIRDVHACGREPRRVVRRGGHVLVRGTFGDRLDGFPTLFRFWPATRQICQQLPTVQQTVRVFRNEWICARGAPTGSADDLRQS
jgi:ubiquinone/menaquinone biosynthesis C-methylase UbiE